jgi:O-succinylhomoserine sulfhydrylase
LQTPIAFGADVIVHSGTKYLDGQGRVVAGALCASQSMVSEKLIPVMRSAGMSLSPFNAWVVLKGLETLSLRMKAQSDQALALATWLEQHPKVAKVHFPGLSSHPQHALAMAQQSGKGGPVLSFDVVGADPVHCRSNAFTVIDSTQLMSITANLGDVKTIITHPASTSHGRLTEANRQLAGIQQSLVRVAVGLEHLDDLKNDLSRGLDQIKATA